MSDHKLTVALQGAAGEAVVMDDDEDEPVDGPEPEPLALPDALPIALVDESLPVSKSTSPSHCHSHLTYCQQLTHDKVNPPASQIDGSSEYIQQHQLFVLGFTNWQIMRL